jgi:hypothetical protein
MKNGLSAAACLTGGEPGPKDRTGCRARVSLRVSCCRVLGTATAGKYAVWPEANAGKIHVGKTAFACPNRFARFARSLQSASREPCRMLRRPVSVVGAERPSRLCVLINPILPRAIHRDQAGEILENLALAARNNRELYPGRTPLNLSARLRAEWDRDALVNEPAHADIHCHAQRQERKQHRRPTVTH